jgi:hypothetical protein
VVLPAATVRVLVALVLPAVVVGSVVVIVCSVIAVGACSNTANVHAAS